jgi:hypothetical protein
MQEDLKQLARELRQETCPRRVIDEATRKIAIETAPPSRLRSALLVLFAGLLVLGGLVIQRRLASRNAGLPTQLAEQDAGGAQIARQAEGALAIIGTVLRDAGAQSEAVISDRAIPPVRNGLETSWNKIIHQTEL